MKIVSIILMASLFYFLLKQEFVFAAIIAGAIVVLIAYCNISKKNKINSVKEKIKKAEEDLRANSEIIPFIDVNKDPHYILELIPGVKRVYALKISNNRRKKIKISSFEDFANATFLPMVHYPLVKKILKF